MGPQGGHTMGNTKPVYVKDVINNKRAIAFMVDRQHVATSNRTMLRIFWNRIGRSDNRYTKPARKALYKTVLKRHRDNFRTFCQVMGGC